MDSFSRKRTKMKAIIKNNLRKVTIQQLQFICIACILVGMFTTRSARALSGFGIGGLFVLSLLFIDQIQFFFQRKNWLFIGFIVLYLLQVASYFQTDPINLSNYWNELAVKAPLFILPFALLLLPGISHKMFKALLIVYISLLVISSFNALLYYVNNYSSLNEAYLRSKAIPVVANHVRYSLMLATGIIGGVHLILDKDRLTNWKGERKLLIVFTLFLFAFIHLLAVRSGLVALYITIGVFGVYQLIQVGKKKWGIIILVGGLLLPIVGIVTVPTLRNKVKNTLNDITHVNNAYSANYHSITARMFSYRVAWQLFEEAPIFGVGIANLRREVEAQYIRKYTVIREENRLMAHNQFLRYLTAFGITGMMVFILVFFMPLFYKETWKKDQYLVLQYVIITVSFLVEGTLETQLGLLYAILFPILYFSVIKYRNEST